MSHGFNYEVGELRNGADEIISLLRSLDGAEKRDAFGRLRTAEPVTLFDSKQIFGNAPLFFDDAEVSGGSTTSTHSTARASTTIGVAATTAGKRVRQTFRRFNYQPGKSQLVLLTGILRRSGGGSGIIGGIGLFDDNNGVFWKDDEGTLKVCVRSSASGSPVDTEVSQASFNGDTLDGNGASGVTLDITKTQIFWIDYEWLGVGTIRFGVVIDGEFIVAHSVNNANSLNVVYMSTPNLPVRYELANDGTGAASTLEHICCTVISEGGHNPKGVVRAASTAGTHVDANAADTLYAIVGIRLKTTHLAATVEELAISTMAETSSDYEWQVLFNPTVAGAFTYADVTNSAVQRALGATANTVTGGTLIDSGWVKSSNSTGSTRVGLDNALRLGSSISGTRDTLVLCARPLSVNADIQGGMTWRELL